jgi:hypothetical protein
MRTINFLAKEYFCGALVMRRGTLGVFATLALGGCAYVPDLEPETSFSYAEVAQQIECETYYAAALLMINDDDSRDDDAFDRWSMDITITPNLSYESQAALSGSHKLQLTPNFVQLTVGGGASPSSANYDMYGTANAKNEYQFGIAKLFQGDPKAWKKSDYIIGRRGDGSIVKVHRISPQIEDPKEGTPCRVAPEIPVEQTIRGIIESARLDPVPSAPPASSNLGVPNFLNSAGFFGVYDFLKRSFLVNDVLSIPPKTLTYSKEYKVKVQLGITPGWFTLHGNISPNVGGIRIVDNTVTLAFAPPAPPTQATEVIIVGSKVGFAPKVAGVAVGTTAGSHNGVSPRTSDALTNAVNSALFSSQLNRLNLPSQ